MRILHTESGPNWGGQEMRTLEQISWLNAHGHEAWIAARQGSKILERARQESLPCFEVPFRGHASLPAIAKLYRLTRKFRIDVIDCHGSRDASHCALLKGLGTTVVRTLHLETINSKPFHRLIWHTGNHRIIVVAEIIKRHLTKLGHNPAKIDVIGEGIDLDEFNCTRSGDKIRAEFEIPADQKVVTNIGMIRPDKGQKYLVEAAEAIAAAIPKVRFLIVGAGTRPKFEDDLRAQINDSPQRDKFILTGFRTDVGDLVAASDCIVVSSLEEAHSRVVPQAFAMKRPVVATRVGGLPGLVTPGLTGRLVAPADAASMAEGVIASLNSDNRDELENAHAFAQENFDFHKMMERTLKSYQQAVDSR